MAALLLQREDGPRVHTDAMEEGKISCPGWESKLMIARHIA